MLTAIFVSFSHVPLSGSATSGSVQAASCVQCGHFFKFRAIGPTNSTITLKVNGKDYTGRVKNILKVFL